MNLKNGNELIKSLREKFNEALLCLIKGEKWYLVAIRDNRNIDQPVKVYVDEAIKTPEKFFKKVA